MIASADKFSISRKHISAILWIIIFCSVFRDCSPCLCGSILLCILEKAFVAVRNDSQFVKCTWAFISVERCNLYWFCPSLLLQLVKVARYTTDDKRKHRGAFAQLSWSNYEVLNIDVILNKCHTRFEAVDERWRESLRADCDISTKCWLGDRSIETVNPHCVCKKCCRPIYIVTGRAYLALTRGDYPTPNWIGMSKSSYWTLLCATTELSSRLRYYSRCHPV